VTLTRLVLAWLPVAVEFAVVGRLGARLQGVDVGGPHEEPRGGEPRRALPTWHLWWRSTEAAVVTLFASLWFDSLGHGGWWLLFGLVGVLVALQRPRREVRGVAVDVARYVLAGAILAWRLG